MLPSVPAKILLVDDVPANLDVLVEVLRDPEYELHRASGGKQALQLLLEHEYACCLLDIRMPEIDGFQVAEFIRKDEQLEHLPILFVTAEAGDQKSVFAGYEKGAVDYIIKPFSPVVLRSKVRVFADLFRQRKALERTEEIAALNGRLTALNEVLIAANSDLEHFAHIASHDLKEPVRKQCNLLGLLKIEAGDLIPKESQKLLTELERASAQMLMLVNDLRSLTKLDYTDLKRVSVNLRGLIGDLLAGLDHELKTRGVRVSFADFPKEIMVYEPLVRRHYLNMIRNALDHTRIDGFELQFLAERNRRDQWRFGVRNTGSSIQEGDFPDIFKLFRKKDVRSAEQSGMGLTICKRIVDRHLGHISVRSGADDVCFTFTFGEWQDG